MIPKKPKRTQKCRYCDKEGKPYLMTIALGNYLPPGTQVWRFFCDDHKPKHVQEGL